MLSELEVAKWALCAVGLFFLWKVVFPIIKVVFIKRLHESKSAIKNELYVVHQVILTAMLLEVLVQKIGQSELWCDDIARDLQIVINCFPHISIFDKNNNFDGVYAAVLLCFFGRCTDQNALSQIRSANGSLKEAVEIVRSSVELSDEQERCVNALLEVAFLEIKPFVSRDMLELRERILEKYYC